MRQMKTKTSIQKSVGCSKSSFKMEVYSDTSLPQETRKISNKQPDLTPGNQFKFQFKTWNQFPSSRELEKEQLKPQFSRKKKL